MTTNVGFLFNHEAAHQVSHLAPMIPALARCASDVHITVMASSQDQLDHVKRLIGEVPGCDYVLLTMTRTYQILDKVFGKVAPLRRYATLKNNLDLFRTLDALIVPERTSLLLRDRFGLKNLKLVRVCHGAGDRDVAWHPSNAGFDFMMLPGPKHRDGLMKLGYIRPGAHAIIGYMKFDALRTPSAYKLPFKNKRPVVLYNPHFDPYLSSWYDMGEQILDYFSKSKDFNLIFAPHVMLFKRRLHTSLANKIVRWRKDVSDRFQNCDNILIDTGSERSIDMTYQRAADIYLGDVSSQVYEFIADPRPCIFVNAHGADWRNDPKYRFWSMGPVVETIDELHQALVNSQKEFVSYSAQQQRLFRESIDLEDKSSADRAAEAFCNFMRLDVCQPTRLKKLG